MRTSGVPASAWGQSMRLDMRLLQGHKVRYGCVASRAWDERREVFSLVDN